MNFKDLFLKEQSLLSAADIGALSRMFDAARATETNEPQSDKSRPRMMSAAQAEGDVGQKLKDWHARAFRWAATEYDEGAKVPAAVAAQAENAPPVPASRRKSSTSLDVLAEDVVSDYKALESAHDETKDEEDDEENAGSFLEINTNSATGEPFVSFVGMDRTGLALSGGGIRSATFNLGLLQGLNQHGLLEDIDYLATVSGGGYIGGWWSAWKQRIGRRHGLEFPAVQPRNASPLLQEHPPEPDEVRHLREFSNFLIPRMGFFNVDMWYGVVAIVSGVLPTLFMAFSLMGLTWGLWLFCDFQLGIRGVWPADLPASPGFVEWISVIGPPPLFLFGLNVFVLAGFEWWWRAGSGIRRDSADLATRASCWFSAIAVVVASAVHGLLIYCDLLATKHYDSFLSWQNPRETDCGFDFSVLTPVVAWIAAAAVLLVGRYLLAWSDLRTTTIANVAASSRVLGRLLGMAIIWLLLSLGWEAGRAFAIYFHGNSSWHAAGYGSIVVAAAEVFRRIRSWMTAQPTKVQTGSMLDLLKPLLPQILAYFVLGASFVFVAAAISGLLTASWLTLAAAVAIDLIVLTFLCWLVDPESLGLHAFYREKILRTYLGASNTSLASIANAAPSAADNRRTLPDPRDDVILAELVKDPHFFRPLHLVCCTANDLGGNQLANLERGARSAALSPYGVSIGNVSARTDDLLLSSAQTASAAAFNSQMGSLSRQFGPAVTFLMAALNLRLGLWLRVAIDPVARREKQRKWRGWLLLREFWSGSVCPAPLIPPQDIHLSDGGHFENLGLYELVRRHCRFIIVSDCGADPDYKFDDLGNALRRIRVDFGVEIEIDVTPLIPGPNGFAAQHMVVGTIHYDGESDQGLLFLFKPNLLGEEPDDIQQYRRRNAAFPQESTGDQFYDEAQWESYRRLGEHAARSAFRFLERIAVEERPSRYYVFTEAFWRWCRTPGGLSAEMLEQTLRSNNFITRLRESDCHKLLDELLPEVVELQESADTGKLVLLLMELTQVMEDAFVALNLGETYSHPLNVGWGNLFRRWTESALYRRWWPVLQPLYSRPFRQFLDDEFGLEAFSPGSTRPTGLRNIVPLTDEMQNDESWKSFASRYPERAATPGEKLLLRIDFGNGKFLCVGLLTWTPDNGTATWTADDLFVRPPLRGVNIIAAFLPDLLDRLRPNSTVEVNLDSNTVEHRTDAAFRAFHADRLRMYMALGFKLRKRQGRQYLTKKL